VANRELARAALEQGDTRLAEEHARAAMAYPANLGEGKHLLTPENEVQLVLARCLAATGDEAGAREWLERAATPQGDPSGSAGDGPFWQAAALRDLGNGGEAEARLRQMLAASRAQAEAEAEARIPYFATSLPTLLLFDDDLSARSRVEATYLEGLALLGLGRRKTARRRFESVLEDQPDHFDAALRLRHTGGP
jgi:tetratricopeptide (TPR) repeat protein